MSEPVVAGMSVAIFGSVINLYSGFCQADPEKLKLIETLGGHKKEKLTKIILPASLPLIISVMKVNIGLCLVGVIIGEFIGAEKVSDILSSMEARLLNSPGFLCPL